MEKLTRNLVKNNNFKDVEVGTLKEMPVKVIQFGEGNFLRAFVDYMIDRVNAEGLFNGSIAVVQPINQGLVNMLKEQDGLYTVLLRGLENGKEVIEKRIVTSISDYINPFEDFERYIAYAESEDLRFFVSNTTEAGIVYEDCDMNEFPQKTFPAKATYFLYKRFQKFGNDKDKGLVFIPCELIDNNGDELKKCVLKYAEAWDLGDEFISWIKESNYFTKTLVDRIVTGYPRAEIEEVKKDLGYEDNLVDTAEIFHNFVIEGPSFLDKELPFTEIGLNVVWTDDSKPYKLRKVRILNGAHTSSVLAAYCSGIDVVEDMMKNPTFKAYLDKALFEDIIPILDLPYEDLKAFADSVADRFANPFIKHYLLSISLNSVSKYKARVLPSILEYADKKGELPKTLMFSFPALINFYKGEEIKNGALIGNRNGEDYEIKDNEEFLEAFVQMRKDANSTKELVEMVCARENMWGQNLNEIEGFAELSTKYLEAIEANGVEETLKTIV